VIQLFLSAREVNLFLRDVEGPWRYEGGCLTGRVKLPLGAVNLVVVPAQQGDHVVLSIPFDQVRGDLTRGLMGPLVKMLWGVISDRVSKELAKVLGPQGLPPDTVTVEKRGNVGTVSVSLMRVNQWLARQQVLGLKPFVQGASFGEDGVRARLGLYK